MINYGRVLLVDDEQRILEGLRRTLQPEFETVRLGIDAFNIDHIDSKMKLYEILLNQPLVVGKLQPGRVSRGAGSPEHRRRVDAKYTGFRGREQRQRQEKGAVQRTGADRVADRGARTSQQRLNQ